MIAKIARELAQEVRAGRRFDRGVRILTYHGVIDHVTDRRIERSFHTLAEFRAHISMLRRCNVVRLDELAEGLARRTLRPRVAITFDDGFRNNMLAVELLAEAKLPATIFITSNAIAREQTIWPTLLRLVLARGSARILRFEGIAYQLDSDPQAFGAVRTLFKSVPTARRRSLWNELMGQLGVGELDALGAAFPSIAQMSWRDVNSLKSSGVSFGSHGFEHELHHADQQTELRIHELTASKNQIEASIGGPCRWFAYPNGTFNRSSTDELRSSGYELGFTMISRAATIGDERALLPRIMPGPGPEKLANAIAFGN